MHVVPSHRSILATGLAFWARETLLVSELACGVGARLGLCCKLLSEISHDVIHVAFEVTFCRAAEAATAPEYQDWYDVTKPR